MSSETGFFGVPTTGTRGEKKRKSGNFFGVSKEDVAVR